MKHQFELLAPGGDLDAIKAAIAAGSDAIYCGLDRFNARNSATNISFETLNGVIALAHQHQCKVFLTLNIMIIEDEIPALIRLLNQLVNTDIDGVILQDIGAFYLLANHFPTLDLHASTQLNTHNEGQLAFVKQLSGSRVNLSRELNINEIKSLTACAHSNEMQTEVFVHGSYCIGFSGLCYISSASSGNSGNRGRCSQPCRDQYLQTAKGNHFPLNLKDNSAFFDISALADAKVDSLKVEGRIKKFHYVHTVVNHWRQHINNFYGDRNHIGDDRALYQVFNRGFSNGYLQGNISNTMFVDNPRDNSLTYAAKRAALDPVNHKAELKQQIYDERTGIIDAVQTQIDELKLPEPLLNIALSGNLGTPLTITVTLSDNSDTITKIMPEHFTLSTDEQLIAAGKYRLDEPTLNTHLKGIGGVKYPHIEFDLTKLAPDLFVPFKALSHAKEQLATRLNHNKPLLKAVTLNKMPRQQAISNTRLSVLIDSSSDLPLTRNNNANCFFQLPDALSNSLDAMIALFQENPQLTPWFGPLLIGEDFSAARTFLQEVKPKQIVTNNSGVAIEANSLGIRWIAGSLLNVANSYSLIALKEQFGCIGAFLSNELNQGQLGRIKAPEQFELHYELFHPQFLMMSRQCLFQTSIGCKKSVIDKNCLPKCQNATRISNVNGQELLIHKSKGGYHSLYGGTHVLNLDIITRLKNRFSSLMIDLRAIPTDTSTDLSKTELIALFNQAVQGDEQAILELQQRVANTCNTQYQKGL